MYADDGLEYVPVEPAATCATRKMYDVPFVRPVTVRDVAPDAVWGKEVQVEPLLLEY
jgi:hypothetical protein